MTAFLVCMGLTAFASLCINSDVIFDWAAKEIAKWQRSGEEKGEK